MEVLSSKRGDPVYVDPYVNPHSSGDARVYSAATARDDRHVLIGRSLLNKEILGYASKTVQQIAAIRLRGGDTPSCETVLTSVPAATLLSSLFGLSENFPAYFPENGRAASMGVGVLLFLDRAYTEAEFREQWACAQEAAADLPFGSADWSESIEGSVLLLLWSSGKIYSP